MSISEDEDDFLSADEAGFADELDIPTDKTAKNKRKLEPAKQPHQTRVSKNISPEEYSQKFLGSDQDLDNLELDDDVSKKDTKLQDSDKSSPHEDEDEQEAQLAEKIRERNLKIARKFSAELAKNVKASAPISVESPRIGFKVDQDIEYPSIPDPDGRSHQPPAPPPTPALSSSYTSSSDPLASPTTSTSQYGWRVPIKSKQPAEPSQSINPLDSKNEQTRLALDRLSESFGKKDSKNVLERVINDIKNVSIKPSSDKSSDEGLKIPSIQDLGSTLGGWGWSGASNLLTSASQVTHQVGSVLDSVVKGSQQLAGGMATHQNENPNPHNEDKSPGTSKN